MSHSYKTVPGTVFIYNPDMSGDVDIVRGDERMTIQGSALVEFMRGRDGSAFDELRAAWAGLLESLEENEYGHFPGPRKWPCGGCEPLDAMDRLLAPETPTGKPRPE